MAPRRGLACALELDDEGPTAQELMVALFARRVAVYPGDGLGEERAATTAAPEPLARRAAAMEHLRGVLGEALDEAAVGALARAGGGSCSTARAPRARARLADRVRQGR